MTWVDDFCSNPKWDESEFSDLSLTGETPCFESIFLTGSVQLAFLLLVPMRLMSLRSSPVLKEPLSSNVLFFFKMLCVVVNFVVPLLFLNGLLVQNEYADFELLSEPLTCLAWLLVTPVIVLEHKRYEMKRAWVTRFLFLFALASATVQLRTKYLMSEAQPDLGYFFYLYCVGYAFLALLVVITYLVQPNHFKALELRRQALVDAGEEDPDAAAAGDKSTRRMLPSSRARSQSQSEAVINPELQANCLSRWTFGWLTPLIRAGYRAPLQFKQMWLLAPRWRAANVAASFGTAWKNEVADAAKAGRSPRLVKAFRKGFGTYFASAGLFMLFQNLFQYAPPILLREIIEYVQERGTTASGAVDHDDDYKGYLMGVGIFACLMFMSLCENQYFDRVIKTGVGLRAGLVTTVYRHALRMSNSARQERSVGAITNHMTGDAERIQMQAMTLHNIWSSPIRIVLGMYLLFDSPLRASVLAGVGLLVLLIPAQVKVMSRLARLLKKQLKEADGRVKVVNEILSGMLVIKYYAWENSFLKKVREIRDRELRWLKSIAITRGVMLLLIGLNPVALAVGTFGAFALANGNLDAGTAFFALSLFNLLFWPILLLPRTISMLLETLVSVRRLEAFLACDTLKDVNFLANDDEVPVGSVAVVDGTFFWDKNPVLKDMTFSVAPGELVAIIGHTGSGKSSVLNALLQEMGTIKGRVGMKGDVAYIAQQAWIFNATVKNNILFGNAVDEARYLQTVDVCCLLPDFDQFGEARDQTEIGEKGINLSGGQKQRISVARAVYADADIYLFDDPLSALDAKVGSRLFNVCIKDHLAGKTRLLVTNQLQYMPFVDRVIVLDEGEIIQQGSFHDLMRDDTGKFKQLMDEYGGVSDEEDEEDAPGSKQEETVADGSAESKGSAAGAGAGAAAGSAGADGADVGSAKPADIVLSKAAQAEAKAKEEAAKEKGKLVSKEHRETGSLSWQVYKSYIDAAGGMKFFASLMAFYMLAEAARVCSSYWLGIWSGDDLDLSVAGYMAVYFSLSLLQTLMSGCASFVGAFGSVAASRELHDQMLARLLRAPMRFFDQTPIGRVLNRFTKDMSNMDTQLMFAVSLFLSGSVRLLGTMVIITVVSPYAIVTFVPVMFAFYFVQRLFRASSRELKRLDSISRSPVYAHFTETLDGMSTIRAFPGAVDRMVLANQAKLDRNQAVYLVHMTANRWLSVRLEFLGGIMILAAAAFAILSNEDGELVGLSLSYALTITSGLNMVVRMSTETENAFNAVERVEEYTALEQERPAITNVKPDNWPNAGRIEMKNVVLRYRKNLDPVLNNLNLVVEAGSKVGVAGRTGAGKSTMFQSLFRIAEIDEGGSILFDGIDIGTVGLDTLRKHLAIIPQNPVLYSGTVRSNLDPFSEYRDEQLWDALSRAQLKKVVSESPAKLEMPVSAGGENFSVGQRQLICLARALLRKSKILVVDEATANVDMETDALIQKTIREQFADTTTLTIAHRLSTIIDSDKICILGAGSVLEYDTPKNLLMNPDSEFSSMVHETGHHNEQYLRSLVLDENAMQAAHAQREELANRADITSNMDNLMSGPLASKLMNAIQVVSSAVETRHGPAWRRELQAKDVSEDVWLGHLYQMLYDLNQTTQAAMREDHFDMDQLAADSVLAHSMLDVNNGPGAATTALVVDAE